MVLYTLLNWIQGPIVTIMTKGECQIVFPKGTMMSKSPLLLKTYSGECLPVLGEVDAELQYGSQKALLYKI